MRRAPRTRPSPRSSSSSAWFSISAPRARAPLAQDGGEPVERAQRLGSSSSGSGSRRPGPARPRRTRAGGRETICAREKRGRPTTLPSAANGELDRHGVARAVGHEAAQPGRQRVRQHRLDAARQVRRRSAPARLAVERRARPHAGRGTSAMCTSTRQPSPSVSTVSASSWSFARARVDGERQRGRAGRGGRPTAAPGRAGSRVDLGQDVVRERPRARRPRAARAASCDLDVLRRAEPLDDARPVRARRRLHQHQLARRRSRPSRAGPAPAAAPA